MPSNNINFSYSILLSIIKLYITLELKFYVTVERRI